MTNELERAAAAEVSAPDPAWIASIANSLFRGVPVETPPGPGANLPSAPAFAPEAAIASIPGVPAATPPLSPNLTPGVAGVPIPGASAPSAPVHAHEPLAAASESLPAVAAAQPSAGKGTAGAAPVSPSPPIPSAGPPQFPNGAQLSETDLAQIPSTLGGAMAVVPSLDNLGLLNGAPGGTLPSAPVQGAEPFVSLAPAASGYAPVTSVPAVPSPGTSPPSAPVFAFEPLTFVGSPTVGGLAQPYGDKGGEAWSRGESTSYTQDTSFGPGLLHAQAGEP